MKKTGYIYKVEEEQRKNIFLTGAKVDGLEACARPTGQEERRCYRILLHTFIQSCFFFISPLFISPSNNHPPSNQGLSLLYTLSSHPRTAGHATSPGTQLQLIRAAGHVSTKMDSPVSWCTCAALTMVVAYFQVYEEVRCKS